MNQSLDLMRARLQYHGGEAQQDRMIKDKRRTLDKVILYSYQGAKVRKLGAESADPALINPNRLKQDYDDKILSIGYEYDYKPGTVFEWVNTNTKWLIYLQDLTELAYFKGDIRKCNYEIKWQVDDETEESGKKILTTYAAIRGPVETKINSSNAEKKILDTPNHTLSMLLPGTKEVLEHFKRYSKFYIQPLSEGDSPICWRVEATDTISMPGVLEINAEEYYINDQKDSVAEGLPDTYAEPVDPQDEDIEGDIYIKPKKQYEYNYKGSQESEWSYSDALLPVELIPNGKKVTLRWKAAYSGSFILQYGNCKKKIVVDLF